jgi:hypothetical protein
MAKKPLCTVEDYKIVHDLDFTHFPYTFSYVFIYLIRFDVDL